METKKKIKILFIAANVDKKDINRSDKEYMAVKEVIENSYYSNYIHLEPAFALNRYKFREVISKYRPEILHFVGHGEKDKGILFQDDDNTTIEELKSETIEILKDYKDILKLVFFNTCQSVDLAEDTSEFIHHVIGTSEEIYDDLAIEYSKKFYENLFKNINLEDSFEIAIDYYSLKYNQNKDDYLLLPIQDHKGLDLEVLIGDKLWNLFIKKFDLGLQSIVNWAIILTLNLKLGKKEKFLSIFNTFLNKFLKIPDSLEGFEKKVDDLNEWKTNELILNIWNKLEEKIEYKSIELEELLTKLNYILKKLQLSYLENSKGCKLEILGFINSYRKNNEDYAELLPLKDKLNDTELKFQLDLVAKNVNKALRYIRVKNEDNIINYDGEILVRYCEQQLKISDLSSKYDIKYDKNLYVEDPELISTFEDFIEHTDDKNNHQRLFLLLGHMGLGKTWNACYLSYKYLEKKNPTFFFHLGGNYQSRFDILLGGFEKSIIKELSTKNNSRRKILIVFDGFDELYQDERDDFIKKLYEWIKDNSEHLMVILTSRLVDWVNTEELRKRSYYKEYIFQNEKFNRFGDLHIRTGASYILGDIKDEIRLNKIMMNYGIDFKQILSEDIKLLLKKPFIVNIISRTNKNIVNSDFIPQSDEWFRIFADSNDKETILRRMGITNEVEIIFQELVSEIADPYTSIPEYELKDFIENNKRDWDVILSSGIIERKRKNLQFEFRFKKEFQGFIERYIVELEDRFQDLRICKADAKNLRELAQNSHVRMNNLSDYAPDDRKQGFVIENKRLTELYLDKLDLNFIHPSVYKLIGLRKLVLFHNQINKISEDIKRLRNLRELDLSQNNLITLPQELNTLPNLKTLKLEYNQLKSIDSWWHDFKSLKTVNISHNNHKLGDLKDQPSIDYVTDKLDYVDNKIRPRGSSGESIKIMPLKLKDAVVLNYLNFTQVKSNEKKYFLIEPIDFTIKSLTISNATDLSPVFWSLEHLEILELRGNSITFLENKSIRQLRLIDIMNDLRGRLELHESIILLKNLELVSIRGYKEIELPHKLKECQFLKILKISSPQYYKFPEIILELNNISSYIFHSSLKDTNFNDIDNKLKEIGNYALICLSAGINLPDIHLKQHIRQFIMVHVTRLPSNIKIESKLKELVIIQNNSFPSGFIRNLKFIEWFKPGCFFFNSRNTQFPNIVSIFTDLTRLRIDNPQLSIIPEWVMQSINIKKLFVTSYNLPSLESLLNDKNEGLFEIKTSASCNFPEKSLLSESLTHLRIDIMNLPIIPEFVGSLKNMKQLLITSVKFESSTSPFGSDENKYRIEIKTNTKFNLTKNINKLRNITHMKLDHLNLSSIPEDLSYLNNLRHLRILYGNLTSVPHFLETLPNLKKVHINASNKDLFRSNFWSYENPALFEIQIQQSSHFTLQNFGKVSHLRISYHSNIKLKEIKNEEDKKAINLENLQYLRLEFINGIPEYIKEMKNLKILELNINSVTRFPDWFSQFNKIKKLIISISDFEFS